MTIQEFAAAIGLIAQSCSEGYLRQIRIPAGRSPRKHDVAVSEWFERLDDRDKLAVENLVRGAVQQAFYTFTLVLDGELKFSENNDDLLILCVINGITSTVLAKSGESDLSSYVKMEMINERS